MIVQEDDGSGRWFQALHRGIRYQGILVGKWMFLDHLLLNFSYRTNLCYISKKCLSLFVI